MPCAWPLSARALVPWGASAGGPLGLPAGLVNFSVPEPVAINAKPGDIKGLAVVILMSVWGAYLSASRAEIWAL